MDIIKIRKAYTLVESVPGNPDEMRLQDLDGTEFVVTPDNARSYMYLGNYALYNHIEVDYEKGEEKQRRRIFGALSEPAYSHMIGSMYLHHFPNMTCNIVIAPKEVVGDYDVQSHAKNSGEAPEWLEVLR